MSRSIAALLLPLLAACGGSGGGAAPAPLPAPQPPPGTGIAVIDMEGRWEILGLERTEDPSAPLPYPAPATGVCTFLPMQRGMTFVVQQGALRDELGQPLRYRAQRGPEDRYVNVADGQVLWFDFHEFTDVACLRQTTIRGAFGSVDADTMEGFVTINVLTTCLQGQFQTPNPNGSFRVRLGRVP